MRSEVLLAVVLASWSLARTAALSISHWDLEGGNRTCGGSESCSSTEDNYDIDPKVIWMVRSCLCDDRCKFYGDCCPDSPYFDLAEQRRGAASFSCVELREYGGIYMRTSCPSDWQESSTREACETDYKNNHDPLTSIPVIDLGTGEIYRNPFCAICHRSKNFYPWNTRIECPGMNRTISPDVISEMLYFNESEESWGVDLNDRFYSCRVDPVLLNTFSKLIRRCVPEIKKTCIFNWTNAEVRARCDAYTTIVYEGDNIYRNPHCAVCNNVPLQQLQCSKVSLKIDYTKFFSNSAFAVLIDFSSGPPGKKQPCDDDQLYDPFFKRCRDIRTEFQPTKVQPPLLDNHPLENNNEPNDINELNSNCTKYLLDKNEFRVYNNTVYVSKYSRRFREGEFKIKEDGKLEICDEEYLERYINKFNIYMGYITFFGLGLSIIFLVLHLTAFFFVEEMWNLPGKNLASLCAALLIAYVSFMTGRFFTGIWCNITAFITFYAFLTSFFWMLTMAFDVWRTLRMATAQLRVSTGKQWRKFIVYSLCSWILPGVIVMIALWTEFSPKVSNDWKLGFVTNSCWFGNSKPLLIFFAMPLAIVMILNIIIFTSCAHMVYSTTHTRFTAGASTKRDFRLYLRLAVLMGLTWALGLLAGTLDIDFLWYLFILFNTLQGLFIFLSFTCKDNVIRGLTLRKRSSSIVTPSTFSWSSDSTIRKSQIDSVKGMDTLY